MTTQANNPDRYEMLDTLTAAVTAFHTWADFKAAMTSGYVPTLWPRKLRKNASLNARMFAKATATLAAMVREEGFRVFDGQKVA